MTQTSRASFLRLGVGVVSSMLAAPFFGAASRALSSSRTGLSVLEATSQYVGGVALLRGEVISLAGVQAYGGPWHGFHFKVDGVLILAPAESVPVSGGMSVEWIGVDTANQEIGVIASFTLPKPEPLAKPPVERSVLPQPPALPTKEPEVVVEPDVTLPSPMREVELVEGLNYVQWTGGDDAAIQDEVVAIDPSGIVVAIWRLNVPRQSWEGYFPGGPATVQTLTVLNSGDILVVKTNAPGTWELPTLE